VRFWRWLQRELDKGAREQNPKIVRFLAIMWTLQALFWGWRFWAADSAGRQLTLGFIAVGDFLLAALYLAQWLRQRRLRSEGQLTRFLLRRWSPVGALTLQPPVRKTVLCGHGLEYSQPAGPTMPQRIQARQILELRSRSARQRGFGR
jgi:hypothetical protein